MIGPTVHPNPPPRSGRLRDRGRPVGLLRLLPKPAEGQMPNYGWAYYDYLVAQYRSLPPQTDLTKQQLWDQLGRQIEEIDQGDPPLLNWNDLCTLEARLLDIEPDPQIQRKAWI